MNRRKFVASTAAGAAALSSGNVASSVAAPPPKRALMKVGHQDGTMPEKMLQFCKRHGVNNICGYPTDVGEKGYWTVEEITQMRERVDKFGLSVDLVQLPFLDPTHVDRTKRAAIMLGQSPERDRDIDNIQTIIRNCSRAGIPCIKYNLTLLGVLRTPSTPGRGGTKYSTWRLKDAKPNPPMTRAGRVTGEIFWERITYFLERVIPVAEEYKVRMACHPHDPGVPPEGYQGVDRVLGTVDGLKKFVSIKESPYHGLNFCQGTVSEMLHDPGKEILDVIRYFGSRKKIFNVHFRNIRGHRDDFQEVFPDEGDVDFVKAMMVYKDVEYPYLMMPDHMPHHDDDPGQMQAFAFGFGYIKAMIQTVDALG